jgi:hypothetical protein
MLKLGGNPGAAALAAINARNGLPVRREVLLIGRDHEAPVPCCSTRSSSGGWHRWCGA